MAKFTYFDVAGRALPCRVALFNAFGKDGWTDERLSFAEFGEKKVRHGSSGPPCSRSDRSGESSQAQYLRLPQFALFVE